VDDILVPFVATRLLLLVVGWLSVEILPLSRWVPADLIRHGLSPLVDVLSRWDATNYVRIAAEGYDAARPTDAAFFPLFPMLVRAVGAVAGPADIAWLELASIVVANVALLAALVGLRELARLDLDDATAARSVLYLLVFPTSFFLSAGYAESLFLCMSVFAVLAARRQHWWLAGGLAALAAITRPFGLLVLIPLALEMWGSRRTPGIWRAVPALALAPLMLLAYSLYLAVRVGDLFAFLRAEAAWDRQLMPPWETLATFFDGPLTVHSGLNSSVDLAFTLFAVVAAIVAWRWLRPSYAAFLTALILMLLVSGTLLSTPRFVGSWFPVFLVLALAGRHPAFDRLYVVFGVGLGALFMALFASWYWVA
jgi:hypothetical protein